MRLSRKETEWLNGCAKQPYSLSDSEKKYFLSESNTLDAIKLHNCGESLIGIVRDLKNRGQFVSTYYLKKRMAEMKEKYPDHPAVIASNKRGTQ